MQNKTFSVCTNSALKYFFMFFQHASFLLPNSLAIIFKDTRFIFQLVRHIFYSCLRLRIIVSWEIITLFLSLKSTQQLFKLMLFFLGQGIITLPSNSFPNVLILTYRKIWLIISSYLKWYSWMKTRNVFNITYSDLQTD